MSTAGPLAGYAACRGRAPAAAVAGVPLDRAARAAAAAGRPAAAAHRGDRPAARRGPGRRRRDADLTAQARRSSRSGSGSSCRAGCSTATAGPVPHTLVEVWQANAAGRYRARRRPLAGAAGPRLHRRRPHADRRRRAATGSSRSGPGAYPWGNHHNAWRPAHIHFSLFGRAFTQRLVTQMYFPDDPLFGAGPDLRQSCPRAARERLVSRFSLDRHRARAGRWRTSSTSCCAGRTRRRSRTPHDEDEA